MNGIFRIFLIAFLSCSFTAIAQDLNEFGTAQLDANYCLTLNEEQELNEHYIADISAFDFGNADEAQNVFAAKSNNLITYRVDFRKQQVIVQLHLDRTSAPYDLAWWNTYLQTICTSD